MDDLTEILNTLPRLPRPQLEAINRRTAALLSELSSPTLNDDYLLEGIIVECRKRGLLGPDTRLHKYQLPTHYAKTSAAVRATLEHHLPPLTPAAKAALGQLAARALISYFEKRRRDISPVLLIRCIGWIPDAIEAAYPRALVNGLLPLTWAPHARRAALHP